MFYNHFIATLYHFLGLTYCPSAQCQLLFFACCLLHKKSILNGVQTQRNFLEIFSGPDYTRWAEEVPQGISEGSIPHQGAPGPTGAPKWVVPTLVASCTAALLYKYPNIPETLGESMNFNFCHRKFQKHLIQSKYHLGGVHHVHWCLFDDA